MPNRALSLFATFRGQPIPSLFLFRQTASSSNIRRLILSSSSSSSSFSFEGGYRLFFGNREIVSSNIHRLISFSFFSSSSSFFSFSFKGGYRLFFLEIVRLSLRLILSSFSFLSFSSCSSSSSFSFEERYHFLSPRTFAD